MASCRLGSCLVEYWVGRIPCYRGCLLYSWNRVRNFRCSWCDRRCSGVRTYTLMREHECSGVHVDSLCSTAENYFRSTDSMFPWSSKYFFGPETVDQVELLSPAKGADRSALGRAPLPRLHKSRVRDRPAPFSRLPRIIHGAPTPNLPLYHAACEIV